MHGENAARSERAALFDIDGTLIRLPSTERRFVHELGANGLLHPANYLCFLWTALRRFPVDGSNVLRMDVAYLSGLAVDDVAQCAERWARALVEEALIEVVYERLEAHRTAGDTVVLLSGTPDFLAAAVGSALGVEITCGSAVRTVDGHFSGDVFLRHLYGAEKVRRANELCERFGWRPNDVTCYADSSSDRPLLEWAGRACVVHPSPKLAAEARRRGWDILPS